MQIVWASGRVYEESVKTDLKCFELILFLAHFYVVLQFLLSDVWKWNCF